MGLDGRSRDDNTRCPLGGGGQAVDARRAEGGEIAERRAKLPVVSVRTCSGAADEAESMSSINSQNRGHLLGRSHFPPNGHGPALTFWATPSSGAGSTTMSSTPMPSASPRATARASSPSSAPRSKGSTASASWRRSTPRGGSAPEQARPDRYPAMSLSTYDMLTPDASVELSWGKPSRDPSWRV